MSTNIYNWNMKILNQTEYAKSIGISRQALHKIIKEGRFEIDKDYILISGTPMIIINKKTRNYKPKRPGK